MPLLLKFAGGHLAEGDGIGATLFRTYRLLTRFVAVVDFAVALTFAFTVGFGAGALVSASAQFPQIKNNRSSVINFFTALTT